MKNIIGHCPNCGNPIEEYGVNERLIHVARTAKPGDIAICGTCVELLVMDRNLTLRMPTLKELMAWPPSVHHSVSYLMSKIMASRPISE